jgi:UDP-N-acetylmuramoyl-L-alanyl-D-glutamate--2,6-diaminopimelate ligase
MPALQNNPQPAMTLGSLIEALDVDRRTGVPDVPVTAITSDSREVTSGSVFVAVRGIHSDGHRFVADAAKNGAVACVTQEPVELGRTVNIVVEDSAKALAKLASRFFGDPSMNLRMVGVTGTNGKTSTAHLLRAICERSQWGLMGLIGTVGHGIGAELEQAVHTTPDPVTLHRLLKAMKEAKCSGVVMEVSSHAVRQQRAWGIDFEVGMLTNVTRDHLDYHHSFEDYLAAKREFCFSLVGGNRRKEPGTLIYSLDNEHSRRVGEEFPGKKISTSVTEMADVYARRVDASLKHTKFELRIGEQSIAVHMKLLGSFTVSNAVLAAAGARLLGIPLDAIKSGLESVTRVPGRFDAIGTEETPVVVVDYCHTPDSLERTLKFCRALKPARLITVFGCGGDRDRGKRPIMGEIAQKNSDICYVTSDNPRTEDPMAIIEDILAGMDRHAKSLVVEADRREAIRGAIQDASVDDLVAVCGKGHEDYQIIGATRHHFDDREEALRALEEWRSA